MPTRIVEKPIGPAIDPEVVKRHLGIEHNADDETVLELIEAATQLIQDECSIQLFDATAIAVFDTFPDGPILLERPPVTEVVEVLFVDSEGVSRLLDEADYQVDTISEPARLLPAPGQRWPCTLRGAVNAVTVRFRCGAATTDAVPAAAHKLIIALCATWYEERGVGDLLGRDSGGSLPDSPFFRRQMDHLRWI